MQFQNTPTNSSIKIRLLLLVIFIGMIFISLYRIQFSKDSIKTSTNSVKTSAESIKLSGEQALTSAESMLTSHAAMVIHAEQNLRDTPLSSPTYAQIELNYNEALKRHQEIQTMYDVAKQVNRENLALFEKVKAATTIDEVVSLADQIIDNTEKIQYLATQIYEKIPK